MMKQSKDDSSIVTFSNGERVTLKFPDTGDYLDASVEVNKSGHDLMTVLCARACGMSYEHFRALPLVDGMKVIGKLGTEINKITGTGLH